jgi:SAM-dependent methyltransferase
MTDILSYEERLKELFYGLHHRGEDLSSQVKHRLALTGVWSVREGDRILEIGCGHGETTVTLATVAGPSGRVVAVDSSPPEYGKPPLQQAHAFIKSQPIGQRIDFLTSTNVLRGAADFAPGEFDLAILSHSPWYMASLNQLRSFFVRCRAWAQRLGYAEWDLRPQHINQVPHMIAVLLQGYVQAMHLERKGHPYWTGNVRTIVLAGDARTLAADAGWRIVNEGVHDTSVPLHYCKSEIEKAISMSNWASESEDIPRATREIVCAQRRLLCEVSTPDAIALSTYAFAAK